MSLKISKINTYSRLDSHCSSLFESEEECLLLYLKITKLYIRKELKSFSCVLDNMKC